jgi:CCR4-NOT transcription complex subunit 1
MRLAAHSMVRNLTAGMAMITCRDHLLQSIKAHLKNIMQSVGRVMLPGHMDTIDLAVAVIANDNVELACAFIQKKAVEKAIPEIDKRLNVEIELRKLARKEGRRYCDPVALTYQSERMPEPLRSKVGQVPAVQAAVYEEFSRLIPGFKPLTDKELAVVMNTAPKVNGGVGSEAASGGGGGGLQAAAAPLTASEESWAILEEVYNKLQPFIEQCTGKEKLQ